MARSGPRPKAAHGTALDLGRPGDAVGRLIALALEEDVGPGDRTAEACVPPSAHGSALIFAKEPLIVSGTSAAARVFRALDPGCELEALAGESDAANPGEGILRVRGSLRAILTGERTALNLLMRLCGVATITRRYAQALAGTKTRLLDTRKTTPGMRELEKAAVRAGGGFNHRGALFDGILVKDNHAAAAGGIGEAVRRARAQAHPLLKVEAEVSTPQQIEEALEAGADMLLLDNLDDDELRKAVQQVRGRVPVEASGGMTLDRLPRVAATGVDYVSVGALTHSAPAVDLSLMVEGA
ncbi:MAG: carboxylating nicotinate-nucleotide diphosphorylase [Deltaproteobacteria bacterium]|nr:MAG: carboxylating nicotinate-nucleotide diphosphorylase [Deltaproteobacteria bacterium]